MATASWEGGAGETNAVTAANADAATDTVPLCVDAIPLCVDLDGTLIKSDSLYDSFCALLRRSPMAALGLPRLLARGGKAVVKAHLGALAPLDAAQLPYNHAVLEFLKEERRKGRRLLLATGADVTLAERVAAHLGLFEGVLASDGATNMIGGKKLAGLQRQFAAFDYMGNSTADLPLLKAARVAYVANPSRGLRAAMRGESAESFVDRRPLLPTLLKAIRLHQWAKNVLLFAPLLLSHEITAAKFAAGVVAFFCFSFVASANYLVNDLLDMESDRHHLGKRNRPFAAGDLSVMGGAALAALLVAASCALLPLLPAVFGLWLLLYVAATSAYSVYLKRVPLIDVLVLSGLYALRMMAGGAATGTVISPWLTSLAVFLFLSLAMVKRFSELAGLQEQGISNTHGRGYRVSDLEQIRSFGTASAYASVVVFSLYISRPDVEDLYHHAGRLWLIVPPMLYWLHRVWLLASRGELDEDPVIFAIRDKISLAIGLTIAALAIFATF
jgi:4-hydroxybenzoate polyprenyltransferase/phosphoserine phosphatase